MLVNVLILNLMLILIVTMLLVLIIRTLCHGFYKIERLHYVIYKHVFDELFEICLLNKTNFSCYIITFVIEYILDTLRGIPFFDWQTWRHICVCVSVCVYVCV